MPNTSDYRCDQAQRRRRLVAGVELCTHISWFYGCQNGRTRRGAGLPRGFLRRALGPGRGSPRGRSLGREPKGTSSQRSGASQTTRRSVASWTSLTPRQAPSPTTSLLRLSASGPAHDARLCVRQRLALRTTRGVSPALSSPHVSKFGKVAARRLPVSCAEVEAAPTGPCWSCT